MDKSEGSVIDSKTIEEVFKLINKLLEDKAAKPQASPSRYILVFFFINLGNLQGVVEEEDKRYTNFFHTNPNLECRNQKLKKQLK